MRIAYATVGEGMPVVWAQQPLASHVQLEWQEPALRVPFAALASKRMLVRYDTRGVGLSDRQVDDFSHDAHVLDLETVVDRLRLQTFALVGEENGGLPAITYAARHPERVTHLILVNSFARIADIRATPRLQALMGLAGDWEMLTENIGGIVFGYGREEAQRYGKFIRACVTPETYSRFRETWAGADLSELLPKIAAPTLVIHHSGLEWHPMDVTRDLVTRIPNAQLDVVEGMYLDNVEQYVNAIDKFLGEGEEPAAGAEPTAAGGMVTILFTDMEGSTSLTQRLGDAAAQGVLRTHNTIVREALKSHCGSEVKHTGDGIMASFGSASKALECAIAMQRAFAEQNESAEEPIRVRMVLNAGEPIAEDDPDGRSDLFGTAVQLAARICGQAEPGQILAPIVVRELAAGKRFLFADRGEVALRGFEESVRLYEVRWQEER